MKLNTSFLIIIFTFLATSNGRRPGHCLPHQSCQEGDCCALGTSCRTCPHGFHVSNDLCAGRGNRQCHYAPTTMPSTTVPSRSPTPFPTGKNDPVYMGCYKNEFGDKRLDGHIGDVSIDHCDVKAAGGLFGMEYPQGFDTLGHAGCLLLTSIPVQSRVPDAECEEERDNRGRRLGDSSRLAVYRAQREDPSSSPTFFTEKPSNLPTATPTASLPSAIPTEDPSSSPTFFTEKPSNVPTATPTTSLPTAEPSEGFFEMDGDCEIVDDCVQSSNYPGRYGNNEQCTITMLRDADLIPGRRFDLETCCDHLMINGVDVESTSMVPQSLTAGTTFFFTSDYSITRGGWQICFTEMASETMNPTSMPSWMPVSASPSQYPSKDPSSSPTFFTKKPSNPVYMGCYKNEFGDKRLDGHIGDVSIDHCDMKAAGGLFGMEYPQGFDTLGHAGCLLLTSIPVQSRVPDAECEAEKDNRGRRLGDSSRLAVYRAQRANQGVSAREQNGQPCNEDADCLSNHCDFFFCSETRSSFFGRRLMQHELMSNARKV